MFKTNVPKPHLLIFGARGYAGLELLKILSQHPIRQQQGFHITAVATDLTSLNILKNEPAVQKLKENISVVESTQALQNDFLKTVHFAFLATPAEVSLQLTQSLLPFHQIKIIDLSGAFRLPAKLSKEIYSVEHNYSEQAVYGLQPFAINDIKPSTRIISNPGCYATAIQMALIPLLKKNLISTNIVIDAKSGTSGAGKKPNENLLFSEANENCTPYRIGKHQHTPEIELGILKFSKMPCNIQLITHLLPVSRGISAGIYTKTKTTPAEIFAAYEEAFYNYPLVQYGQNSNYLKLTETAHTGLTSIYFEIHHEQLYLFSIIDNLQKGAASQAIENFNLLNQQPIHTGVQI